METAYSLSDIASVLNDGNGFGGNSAWVLIILFALIFGWGGNGFGGNRQSDFGQFATASSQNELLLGQKFDALGQKINAIGDGLCSSTYALNNSIQNEGRALQSQLSTSTADTNAVVVAQTQKILDSIAQNKIESLQAEVNNLKTQNMFCGIPRISNYAYGVYPYATNGCGCNNLI